MCKLYILFSFSAHVPLCQTSGKNYCLTSNISVEHLSPSYDKWSAIFFSFQIKKQIHLIFFIECAQATPCPAWVLPCWVIAPSSVLVSALCLVELPPPCHGKGEALSGTALLLEAPGWPGPAHSRGQQPVLWTPRSGSVVQGWMAVIWTLSELLGLKAWFGALERTGCLPGCQSWASCSG